MGKFYDLSKINDLNSQDFEFCPYIRVSFNDWKEIQKGLEVLEILKKRKAKIIVSNKMTEDEYNKVIEVLDNE